MICLRAVVRKVGSSLCCFACLYRILVLGIVRDRVMITVCGKLVGFFGKLS